MAHMALSRKRRYKPLEGASLVLVVKGSVIGYPRGSMYPIMRYLGLGNSNYSTVFG